MADEDLPVLQLVGVTKSFGDRQVLQGLSLDVEAGEIVGVIGPNASGKSTALRILMGHVLADSGEVLYRGHLMTRNLSKNIGYVPEDEHLQKKMAVRPQLEYLARLNGAPWARAPETVDAVLERLQLTEHADTAIENVNLGTRHRVELAGALVHEPAAIVLDEPDSGLDPSSRELLSEVLIELADRGVAILLSSHQVEFLEGVCDRVVILSAGRIGPSVIIDADDRYGSGLAEVYHRSLGADAPAPVQRTVAPTPRRQPLAVSDPLPPATRTPGPVEAMPSSLSDPMPMRSTRTSEPLSIPAPSLPVRDVPLPEVTQWRAEAEPDTDLSLHPPEGPPLPMRTPNAQSPSPQKLQPWAPLPVELRPSEGDLPGQQGPFGTSRPAAESPFRVARPMPEALAPHLGLSREGAPSQRQSREESPGGPQHLRESEEDSVGLGGRPSSVVRTSVLSSDRSHGTAPQPPTPPVGFGGTFPDQGRAPLPPQPGVIPPAPAEPWQSPAQTTSPVAEQPSSGVFPNWESPLAEKQSDESSQSEEAGRKKHWWNR